MRIDLIDRQGSQKMVKEAAGMEKSYKSIVSKKKDGFSLVELIIVIAIIAILIGLAGLGFGYMKSADAKGVTNGINSGLSELKSQNMAKNKPVYMNLYEYDGDWYIQYSENDTCTEDGSGKNIGSSQITVALDGTALAEGASVSFGIRKKDGAFVAVNGSEPPAKIDVSSVNGSHYTIVLVKDTGKHYIE